jgi:hypothetical protein
MSLKPYFTNQYLFQINTAYVSVQEKLFFFAGIILVLVSVVLKISATLAPLPVDKKYRQKFYGVFLTIGICELVWYLCRYEDVAFFGSHFVAWLVILIGLVWLVTDIVLLLKNYKHEKLVWQKEQIKLKYLPK